MNAHHDIGQHGIFDPVGLVRKLQNYGKVFISSEKQIPSELDPYLLKIPLEKIHDVLYYATLFISDSQTMSTEAAVLGTPAVRCNSFVGKNDMSNYLELQNKYGLIFNFQDEEEACTQAIKMIQNDTIKQEWQNKRMLMLGEKIDPTSLFISIVDNSSYTLKDIKAKIDSINSNNR
jgi:hypothetical protein